VLNVQVLLMYSFALTSEKASVRFWLWSVRLNLGSTFGGDAQAMISHRSRGAAQQNTFLIADSSNNPRFELSPVDYNNYGVKYTKNHVEPAHDDEGKRASTLYEQTSNAYTHSLCSAQPQNP
jgi:hypothetical protein